MFGEIVSWLAVILAFAASTTILIRRDWRYNLGGLAVQYLAAFWLSLAHIPLGMGSVKLVVGWMTVAVLGMTRLSVSAQDDEEESFMPQGQPFRIVLMGIVGLVALGSMIRIEEAIPGLGLQVTAGSIILIGAGLAQISMTSNILRVSIGLLSMLSGFEILYVAVESSILVAGLLAAVTLGLGIASSYLLTSGEESSQSEEEIL